VLTVDRRIESLAHAITHLNERIIRIESTIASNSAPADKPRCKKSSETIGR
jgi:CO/xanthine dehydrogenase FAD-binding subunit